VQSRNTPGSTAPTGFPESAKSLDVETANFFFSFFENDRRQVPDRQTESRSFTVVAKGVPESIKSGYVIHWKEIKGNVFVTKVLRS